MATIVQTIGAGKSFSTIQAWEDALPASLVTDGNSYVGELYDAEFTAAGTVVTISGETTDASHTITLRPAAGLSFRNNASVQSNPLKYDATKGVGIRMTGAYATCIHIVGVSFVTFSGLQIKTDSSASTFALTTASGATDITMDNCIVDARTGYVQTPNNALLRNCLLISRSGSGQVVHGPFASGVQLINCTLVSPSDIANASAAITNTYGGITIKNCAVFGFGSFVSLASGSTASGSNNASDQAIPFGSANQASKTYANQFVGTTSAAPDFKIKTGADCVDTGVTDTTNAAIDIAGTARPSGTSYDIGCWELVQAGATFIAGRPRVISHQAVRRASFY